MSGHGGARPGAGRKAKADKHSGAVAEAEQRLADRLPRTIDNLELLADGEAPRVEERWEAAGTITVEVPALSEDGRQIYDAKGQPATVERLVFPDRPPEELVLVERKVVNVGPDFRANEYLANRILGKPTERHELTGEDGAPLAVQIYIPANGRDDTGAGDPAQLDPSGDVPKLQG